VHTVSKAVAYYCLDKTHLGHSWTDEETSTAYACVSCPLEMVWRQTLKAAERLAEAPRTPDMALSPGKVFGENVRPAMALLKMEIAKRRAPPGP